MKLARCGRAGGLFEHPAGTPFSATAGLTPPPTGGYHEGVTSHRIRYNDASEQFADLQFYLAHQSPAKLPQKGASHV